MSTAKRQDDADYSSTEVSIETMFADAVKALRGDTYTLGPNTKSDTAVLLPDGFDKRPTTAPDIAFNLPNQPFLIAQINTMQLETTLENPEPHFILTQSQYRLIMDASRSFHTFFIIYCEMLGLLPGLSSFSYVSRADLHSEQITAFKQTEQTEQTEQTKPRYCLPLHILRPLSELVIGNDSQSLPLEDNRRRARHTDRVQHRKPVQGSGVQTKG
jgi:hypothetical protein